MNIFADIKTLVLDGIAELTAEGVLPEGLELRNIAVEPPRDAAHGDMATNAAMVLAKPAKKKPRDIADALVAKLAADARVTSAEVAGPGFINLRLAPSMYQSVVGAAVAGRDQFGRSDMGKGKTANVEFVSANPTGPLHVGHCRGAVFGDALAGLLGFAGYDVTREYWINDGGAQVDVLARSAYERYREANGLEPVIAEGLYPGDYLIPVGQALKEQFGDSLLNKPEEEWLEKLRDIVTEMMMDQIRTDMDKLGVKMDVFTSEKSYYASGKIEKTLEELTEKGLLYRGVLEPPKGKEPDEDWEPREQLLFKSTEYGDDVDRPVQKSNGGWTYFAPDLAYHYDKVKRGFDVIIDVFGADHGGYVKRMKAIVAALGGDKVDFDIKLCQLVKLFKNGEPFKMSKRAGTFVTLAVVIDQVGPDVTRFVMLTRKNDAPLDFDFAKALEQSKDNPVFYVQYAHARVQSVMRTAQEAGIDTSDLTSVDLTKLDHAAELQLAAKVAEWPRLLETAARANEPHRIAFYLYDLASEFHSLWNKGKDEKRLRYVQESDVEGSRARLALIDSAAVVIANGLGILGVTPLEEMR